MATVYTLTMKEDLVPVSNNRGLLQTCQGTLGSAFMQLRLLDYSVILQRCLAGGQRLQTSHVVGLEFVHFLYYGTLFETLLYGNGARKLFKGGARCVLSLRTPTLEAVIRPFLYNCIFLVAILDGI